MPVAGDCLFHRFGGGEEPAGFEAVEMAADVFFRLDGTEVNVGRFPSHGGKQAEFIAVGRKNWLFAGSFEGARRAALLYSLVQSCKLVDVAPFPYLKDVLLRIATHPHRLIDQLTPQRWAETFGSQPSV